MSIMVFNSTTYSHILASSSWTQCWCWSFSGFFITTKSDKWDFEIWKKGVVGLLFSVIGLTRVLHCFHPWQVVWVIKRACVVCWDTTYDVIFRSFFLLNTINMHIQMILTNLAKKKKKWSDSRSSMG